MSQKGANAQEANTSLPNEKQLAQKVYFIRAEKVMLDADLADLYGAETSALNRAVKRNMDRFPSDFMFQLTHAEWHNLKCQIGMSSADQQPRLGKAHRRIGSPV